MTLSYQVEIGQAFLSQFCAGGESDFYEIRTFRESDEKLPPEARRWFQEPGEEAAFVKQRVARGEHVYIGIAARAYGKGKGEDLHFTDWVWAEVDFKDYAGGEAEARSHIADFVTRTRRTPWMVVLSGGGMYVFWRIERVALPENNLRVKRVLQRIACELGADGQAVDPPRVLRLPGTYNVKHKYGAPRLCTLDKETETGVEMYRLEDFEADYPTRKPERNSPRSVPASHSVQADTLLTRALRDAVVSRHKAGLWLACQLRDNGFTLHDAESVMRDFQYRSPARDHPYDWTEAETTLKDAYKRTPRAPWEETERKRAEYTVRPSAPPSTVSVAPAMQEPPPWEPPIPLHEYHLPAFPADTFPEWMRSFVEAVALATQTPPDLAGMLALSVCAVAVAILIKGGISDF